MSGIYTFTIEPTAETVVWGLIRHAWAIAALVFLAGQLFASSMLHQDEEVPCPEEWRTT